MADQQLTMHLAAGLPRPGDVAPMWPMPCERPFDDADTCFAPTWSGHRVLVHLDPAEDDGGIGDVLDPDGEESLDLATLGTALGGVLRLVDANDLDLGPRLPELATLRRALGARSAVLDGELVAVDPAGRADPEALRNRLAGNPGRPVTLLVFDLLHADGQWLLGRPLHARLAALRRLVRDSDRMLVVPTVTGEGLALHAAVTAQGIAGVLARRRSSPYLPGVRSHLWQAIPAGIPPADVTTPDTALVAAAGSPVQAVFRRLPLFPSTLEVAPGDGPDDLPDGAPVA